MKDGYDLLIDVQSVETMESLDSEEVLDVLGNEKRFEVISRLCERLSFLVYQDSNFGILPKSPSSEAILSSVSRLCKSSIRAGFPVERPALLSEYFSSSYLTSAAFSKNLIENDDRFLTTCLCLLPLIDSLPSNSVFHPAAVFLEGMHHLHYNCEVLLEWLNSELAASSLILRVLKSCCNPETRRFWKEYVPTRVDEIPIMDLWSEAPLPDESCHVVLNVIEIVGDQEMTKKVSLRGETLIRHKKSEPAAPQNNGSFLNWIATVHELKKRLGRLLKARLVPEKLNVILKWCDTFCQIFQEQ